MNVSPDALRKETVETLKDVEKEINQVRQYGNDATILSSLLLAKAQCLNTLVLLNEKK